MLRPTILPQMYQWSPVQEFILEFVGFVRYFIFVSFNKSLNRLSQFTPNWQCRQGSDTLPVVTHTSAGPARTS